MNDGNPSSAMAIPRIPKHWSAQQSPFPSSTRSPPSSEGPAGVGEVLLGEVRNLNHGFPGDGHQDLQPRPPEPRCKEGRENTWVHGGLEMF